MFRTAIFATAFAFALANSPASAQPVDLQLVLAVDTSGSVSEQRFELQKQGYVAAFRSPQLLRAFADAVDKAPRQLFGGGTSISGAIDHAMTLFPRTDFKGARRVIDVSGDGANNRGRPANAARDDAVRDGATINGLPILALEPYLERYYWESVVGGPGAFVIAAESYETFAEAVLKKLVIEIAAAPLPLHAANLRRSAQ
jgi:hypothetical protein